LLSRIKATALEQTFLETILDQNSRFLSPAFKPERRLSETPFKLSFLLPLTPLSFDDIAKFNNDPGCRVCGKKTVSRCSSCQSVSYCSAGEDFPFLPHNRPANIELDSQNVKNLTGLRTRHYASHSRAGRGELSGSILPVPGLETIGTGSSSPVLLSTALTTQARSVQRPGSRICTRTAIRRLRTCMGTKCS
jgi:hypothetical protein